MPDEERTGGYFPQCANRWNDRLCPKQRKEKIFCDECENTQSFKGDLRMKQELAAEKLLSHSDGVLSAATAFGKTVVCSYLIAERKVNTLILLQSKDLLNQWVDELNHFLEIREEPPEYETKTGRKKKEIV